MTFFFLLLLLFLIVGGYYVYKRLLELEREIRAEQSTLDDESESSETSAEEKSSASAVVLSEEADVPSAGIGLEERVVQAVIETPGLAQTELYQQFPDDQRRDIQKLLRKLDQAGNLRREKQGSSYCLYPL